MIAGNWKMHKTTSEATELARGLVGRLSSLRSVDVVVGPTFTSLVAVARTLEGSRIGLAAQNVHWAEQGAYTGDVSVAMLRDIGCTHVLVGHSERRQYQHETDEDVRKKTAAALAGGLCPIVCFGESLAEREAEQTLSRIRTQVSGALEGLSGEQVTQLVLAYEPIWAIGTGRTATPEQAQEVHAFVRGLLRELFGAEVAAEVRVLYGGSVKPGNVDALMTKPDIDGALVGGAALKVDSFTRIARFEQS